MSTAVSLDGRVVLVTGAGRGLGLSHATLLASMGARVVVNDRGVTSGGDGEDVAFAQEVAAMLRADGGEAVANTDSVTDFDGVGRMVRTAIEAFGRLDAVVSNAGVLRDRMLVNMDEADFDVVIDVHLKGSFNVLRHAAGHWRDRSARGEAVHASVVQTSSSAGLFNNVGQANYAPAKAAIATLGQVAAKELARYGVRVNTIAPLARTRLVEQTPGLRDLMAPGDDAFDPWDPANISPLLAYLVSAACPITGAVLQAAGDRVDLCTGWSVADSIRADGTRFAVDDVATAVERMVSRHAGADGARLPSEGAALGAALLEGPVR